MVGNRSVPAVTLCVLAMHATITPRVIVVAEEDAAPSNTVDNNHWKKRRISKRKNHLRHKKSGSITDQPEHTHNPNNNGWNKYKQEKDQHGSTWDESADATLFPQQQQHQQRQQYPAQSHRKLASCEYWYPSRDNADGCTNNPNHIVPEWLSNPQMKGLMLHPTADACCDIFFSGKECKHYPHENCDGGGSSSCVSLGWHADTVTQRGCTDDDNYPEQWLGMKSHMFHSTPEKCCSAHFLNDECEILHSGCSSSGGGGDGAAAGAGDGGGAGGSRDCITPGWYADPQNKDGCSNGDTYMEEWLNPSMKSNMFFATSKACCNMFFRGRTCKIYDVGCTIDPDHGGGSFSTCESEWHPDVERKTGCANDSNYPPTWKSSNVQYFFSSAKDCCRKYRSLDGECQARDACNDNAITDIEMTSQPTPSPTFDLECMWHPSTKSNNGASTCEYSDVYPQIWMNPDWVQNYLFDSHEECCKIAHNRIGCGKSVICDTPMPTASPTTGQPTSAPVPPTAAPSGSPTSLYYVQHLTGKCVLDSHIPKPYYIKETFTDYDECCQLSFQKDLCLMDGPTDPPSSFWPTLSPAPTTLSPTVLTFYYVEHFTGVCTMTTSATVPLYVAKNKRYKDHRACCKHSYDKATCLREAPTEYPTYPPTTLESFAPSSPPSMQTRQPSSEPSERLPTASPTTFYWGAYMSFTSKPTHRPTKQDCSDTFWYAYTDDQQQGWCTNYDPATSPTLLFQTAEECCASAYNGLDCSVRDICSLNDSVISAGSNLPQPELNSCENYWHPDIDYGRDGCSNSRHFPDSWKKPKNKVNLLFDNFHECCQQLYLDQGNDCKIYNHCATTEHPTKRPTKYPTPRPTSRPVTPRPTSTTSTSEKAIASSACDYAKWHIAVGSKEMACSNSLTYPDAWDLPVLKEKFLFDSYLDCCHRFAFESSCAKYDDCSSESAASMATLSSTVIETTPNEPEEKPCLSARWHMSTDFKNCNNSFDYPLRWLDQMSRYFFEKPTECCLGVFNYADCPIEDICASDVAQSSFSTHADNSVYPSPTQNPTLSPSAGMASDMKNPSPTQNPTLNPSTGMPTREPSTTPTQAPSQKFSSLSDSDQCNGKSKKPCSKDPGCKYDQANNICVKIVPQTLPSHAKPKPSLGKPATASAPSSSTPCREKPKKKCVKDPKCIWDETSCAQRVAAKYDSIPEYKVQPINTATSDQAATVSPPLCDKGRKWHPKTINDRICSNSHTYPELWDNPSYSQDYLYGSFKQCCKVFYGGQCDKEDVCDESTSR